MKHTQEEYAKNPALRVLWKELFNEMHADEIAFIINSYYLEDNAMFTVEYLPEKVRR